MILVQAEDAARKPNLPQMTPSMVPGISQNGENQNYHGYKIEDAILFTELKI